MRIGIPRPIFIFLAFLFSPLFCKDGTIHFGIELKLLGGSKFRL